MKKLHKFLVTLSLLYTILFCPFAEANEMKYSLTEETPTLQSNILLDWGWWEDDPEPKSDSTAFKMDNILGLEEKLNQAILGQEFAVSEVTNQLINYQAGINDPGKPIGVFLFIGPSGVGKTQLAKELSKALLGSEIEMIRLDMSQYVSSSSISSLIGSDRGYVDSDKGGVLTEALRGRKNSIILLDEIEKASPEVLKLFLSSFDEGRITSSQGETFNLNSALFILTTNIASEEILKLSNDGFDNESILNYVEGRVISYLSPEFYNRTIPTIFKAIPQALYPKIIDKELDLISKRLWSLKKIRLTFDLSVNEYLCNSLQSNRLGVRPLKRLIEKHVVGNLSRFIVTNNPKAKSNLYISVEGNNVIIKDLGRT